MGKSDVMNVGAWTLRYRFPPGNGPFPVILMLHGWTGDEDAMWIFASRLPKDHLLLAPRGMSRTPSGGYGWYDHRLDTWPSIADLKPAANALMDFVDSQDIPIADFSRLSLVGFSQGAALCYTMALLYPQRFQRVAGLSGFIPRGNEILAAQRQLRGLPVFITHGTKDELVPVEKGRAAADVLEVAGANVTYCEDEVGHKLSSYCFRGLENFFNKFPSK